MKTTIFVGLFIIVVCWLHAQNSWNLSTQANSTLHESKDLEFNYSSKTNNFPQTKRENGLQTDLSLSVAKTCLMGSSNNSNQSLNYRKELPQLGHYKDSNRTDPLPPSDVTISITSDIVHLSWTAVLNATSYIVEGSNNIAMDYVDVTAAGTLSASGEIMTWEALVLLPYHFYRVRSVGSSMPSNFVFVEGGMFNNGISDVTVSSFYIDKYELTQSEYLTIMTVNPSYFPGVINGPVEQVSWFNAIEYCNRRSIAEGLTPCYSFTTWGTDPDGWPATWDAQNTYHTRIACNWTANGYRLPTEAEWEFAARGGNFAHGYLFSGSDNIEDVGWSFSNALGTTHSVGALISNELGTYDMSGNVHEWIWDIYGTYPSSVQNNPHGPATGTDRGLRSGCWNVFASYCTVSSRSYDLATHNNSRQGFRVCRIGE